MIKKLALVLIAAIAVILIYAATRPDSFRVEREARIQAPPDAVFARLHDFHRWGEWSPWEKLDPALKRTFSGKDAGTGAVYAWEGNDQVGAGRMEITDAAPPNRLTIQLDFFKPFETRNTTVFTLEPQGEATRVHWAMNGPSPYLSKLIGVFVDMDTMIGKDFEAGLANLKAASEKK